MKRTDALAFLNLAEVWADKAAKESVPTKAAYAAVSMAYSQIARTILMIQRGSGVGT